MRYFIINILIKKSKRRVCPITFNTAKNPDESSKCQLPVAQGDRAGVNLPRAPLRAMGIAIIDLQMRRLRIRKTTCPSPMANMQGTGIGTQVYLIPKPRLLTLVPSPITTAEP